MQQRGINICVCIGIYISTITALALQPHTYAPIVCKEFYFCTALNTFTKNKCKQQPLDNIPAMQQQWRQQKQ